MSDTREVTAGLRVDDENPGHVTVSVFVGRRPGARGHAGKLVFRRDEWDELGQVDSSGRLVVRFDTVRS